MELKLCACMGLIGNDPYCPCEMERRGLKSDAEWTPEKIEEFKHCLGEMFGWDKEPGEQE